MAVKIELPEDIEHHLAKQWGDLPRHALEPLAIEGYRARVLSRAQNPPGAETMKRLRQVIQYKLENTDRGAHPHHDEKRRRRFRRARISALSN